MGTERSTQERAPRWGRIGAALVATATLAVSACGLVKTAYQNADTVGLLWINRYFDLSSDQKDWVKPKLRELVAWHRRTELREYAAITADLKRRTAVDITPAEIARIEDVFHKRIDALVERALPDAADLALRLTPDNIETMREKFASNDEKFRDDFMKGDVERQQKARYEKVLDRTEEWYGRFSRDQRAAIRKLSDARPMNNEAMLAERQRRQRELVDLLARVQREKPSRDAVVAMMKAYEQRFDADPDRERRSFMESYKRASQEMNAAIHNLATSEQRAKAADKLQDWVETFRSLQTS